LHEETTPANPKDDVLELQILSLLFLMKPERETLSEIVQSIVRIYH